MGTVVFLENLGTKFSVNGTSATLRFKIVLLSMYDLHAVYN